MWVLVGATTFGQYVQLVNPFIGTGGHGHTFPGPTTPFGMVQLGPDTRLEGWDGCSDTIIPIVSFMALVIPIYPVREFQIIVMY